ncbi:MAG TPA: site-specific integrase [Verrucomicrobiae bacterium]|nr:site-specific integrase [Verrucomicrobiae bacterium]
MVATRTKSKLTNKDWPRLVKVGRGEVTVYRRKNGYFQIANYDQEGRRRLESCSTEADALERAEQIATRQNEANDLAACMTKSEAMEYANAVQILKPLGVSMIGAATTVAECLKLVGGLIELGDAAKKYAKSYKPTTAKRVSVVVAEMLEVKARDMSTAYVGDLKSRLNKFAADFERDTCNITTAEIQTWIDGKQKLSSQSRANYKRVLFTFFSFAIARGYASENPVKGIDPIKVRNGEVGIFTPLEITRLLSAASEEFLPVLAIGAFAGLRSAEIERLEWSDIQLTEKIIVVGRDKAKTASRRTVPISDNLSEWLSPYANCSGLVWKGTHEQFYDAQQQTAAATGVEADVTTNTAKTEPIVWKANALRHSFISYRLADVKNAAQVALEAGNSPGVINAHYKELVRPSDALAWFAVKPESPRNVLNLAVG